MKNKLILIFIIIFILSVLTVLKVIDYINYHPNRIVEGENKFKLDNYNITKNGFDNLKTIISNSYKMTSKYNVSYFEANIYKNGNIRSFTLSLNTFDENLKYVGRVGYTYSNNKLTYTSPTNDNLSIVINYDENCDINYLGEQVKKIPLKDQIKVSELNNYVIMYRPHTIIDKQTPIFDGRNDDIFYTLSKQDYNAGKGGISDGNTSVVFRLYSGESIVMGQQYLYVFKPIAETKNDNPGNMMDTDYYINNGTLKFTRDYGKNWIETNITKEQLLKTMDFSKNNLSLEPNSWFMSLDDTLPIAFFYGENPVLKISNDNGKIWNDIYLNNLNEFERNITKRVVGFTSNKFGYVALGTDWSMGAGENKKCYFTYNLGKTWIEKDLPLQCSPNTLNDMLMIDEKNGLVALDGGSDIYFPIIYSTKDTGTNWTKVNIDYSTLPTEIQYLTDIDSLTFENGQYTLTLGQGDSGIKKALFKSVDLNGPWKFDSITEKNIHTVG